MLDTSATLGELTTKEAGLRLGVSDGTVRGMCKRGTLQAHRIFNEHQPDIGSWMIPKSEVDRYLQKKATIQCKLLSDIDKGYIAGFLDGEGCLTAFTTRQHKDSWWITRYFIQIIVKDEAPIKWLKQITGVGYVFQRKRQKDDWKDLWGWRVNNAPACEVLEQILPYLKIKQKQAEIFLRLRDMIMAGKFHRRGQDNKSGLSEEEFIARQKLIEEIHQLNDRNGIVYRRNFSTNECK